MKAATAAAGGLTGVGLGIVGYDAKADVQAAGTILGIRVLMIIIPILLAALSYFIYKKYYTLKGGKMDEVARKLQEMHKNQ